MKSLLFFYIFLLLSAATAQAAPISVGNINGIYVANDLIGTSSSAQCETTQNKANCDFLKTGPTKYLNNAALAEVVTSNPATYTLSPFRNTTYIDLGFNGFDIYNGAGNDLVVFIVGNTTSFGLEIFDINGTSVNQGIFNVATPTFASDGSNLDFGDTVQDSNGNWLCVNGTGKFCTNGAALSAIFIDLGDSIAGDVALGNIRIFLGEDFNGINPGNGAPIRPRLSLAGGFHREATVVPLPLSAALFSSGLALLGWIGRKRTA
jgi:hypothetical protein